jgi:hypothetical protein
MARWYRGWNLGVRMYKRAIAGMLPALDPSKGKINIIICLAVHVPSSVAERFQNQLFIELLWRFCVQLQRVNCATNVEILKGLQRTS